MAGWKFTRVQDLSKTCTLLQSSMLYLLRHTNFMLFMWLRRLDIMCGQWRDVLGRLVEVWRDVLGRLVEVWRDVRWRFVEVWWDVLGRLVEVRRGSVHWFPLYHRLRQDCWVGPRSGCQTDWNIAHTMATKDWVVHAALVASVYIIITL